jgi:methionyl-tRNA formyltransferase
MKALVLGYSPEETAIHSGLGQLGFQVSWSQDEIGPTLLSGFEIVVSFGYRHKIPDSMIQRYRSKLVNLHISLLPWNKGAHPNFWSFYESTPSGVTIHEVTSELDSGPILLSKEFVFDTKAMTFSDTYWQLRQGVEELFLANAIELSKSAIPSAKQAELGSYHSSKELPRGFRGWDTLIHDEILRLRKLTQ